MMKFNGRFIECIVDSIHLKLGALKSFLLIFGFSVALLLNASCRPVRTTDHNLPDPFPDKLARTVHDISQFFKKVTVELEEVPAEGESTSSDGSGKTASDSSSGTQMQTKQVDWTEASLTEKHLKQLGALRIKTVSEGEEVKNSISQAGTFIDPQSQISFINQYYRLDYNLLDVNLPDQVDLKAVKEDPKKLLAFLLGKVDKFYGFPETDYYIVPHLEGNYLVLYRLGLPDTIPYDQLPLARRVGDFLATPLVGYLIDYCVPEHKEDDYGHLSDLIVPNCEGIAAESARYIQFKTGGKKLFQYEEKWDLFPEDFFNGEWFYLRTVIEAGEKDASSIGHQPFDPAHLVEFRKDTEQLVVEDTKSYNLREGDEEISLFIPIKWKEYEKDQDTGAFKSFGEREKPKGIQDVERPYFSLDFNRLIDIEKGNYSGQFTVRRVLITDDSFHFDIHISQRGGTPVVVKYSFKRVADNPDYPEKRWYEEDSARYHVFHVGRKYYPLATEFKKADREKFYRATRFDPNKEEIIWHFSTQTPKDDRIRDFGRWAVEYENRIFQEAGKYSPRKVKVMLDENEDKELGDLRYNIINLVITKSKVYTAFGFGPSIANPITGEIVSATTNVWVSSIENSFIDIVRKYIRFHIWPLPWKLLPSSPGVSDFLHEKIQKLCPEVREFITNYRGIVPPLHPLHSVGVLDYDKDREIQEQCGRKMARVSVLSTTVHEMRHGHGFRHVFSASADGANYYKDYDEIKALFGESILMDDITDSHPLPARFSSLMDYGSLNFPELSVPGKYDIAATRYLYFDQLETIDDKSVVNGFVTLDSGDKSITQETTEGPVFFTDLASNQNQREINESQLKRYFVCGGRNFDKFDNGETDPNNPLCLRFDYGSTPREVVQNAIRNIKDGLMHTRRYDTDSLSSPNIAPLRNIIPFVQKWIWLRGQLFHRFGRDLNDYYMSEESAAEYKGIIEGVSADVPAVKMYYEVIPLVVDFFKEMFFLPIKHCVYQKGDGSYKVVAMNVIHNKIKSEYRPPEHSREVLVHCQSDPVKKWAEEKNMGTFIMEVGVADKSLEYFVHPRYEDYYDELFLADRAAAILRHLSSVVNEPNILHGIFKEIKERVLNGMDLNPYIDKVALRQRLGLPEGAPVPEFPYFPDQESFTNMDPKMVPKPLFGNLMNVQSTLNTLLQKSTSAVANRHLILNYYLFIEQPDSLQAKISELTKDPLQAKEKMFLNYGRSRPFIYQVYLKYLERYDTEQERSEVPFMEFFQNLPSLMYSLKKREFIIPFDENNMFADIFVKYNEYKSCIEKADVCEKLEEKLAYVQVIENSVEMWMQRQQLPSNMMISLQ